MVIEFERGINKNYMITESSPEMEFEENMLTQAKIEGILRFQVRIMNNEKKYYYDITGCVTIDTLPEKIFENTKKVISFFDAIFSTIKNSGKYLLEQNDFMLSPEQIFSNIKEERIYLCCCPGYSKDIRKQIAALAEYVMNNIDYTQQRTVTFIHALYMKSRESTSSINDLIEVSARFKKDEDSRHDKSYRKYEDYGENKEYEDSSIYEAGETCKNSIKNADSPDYMNNVSNKRSKNRMDRGRCEESKSYRDSRNYENSKNNENSRNNKNSKFVYGSEKKEEYKKIIIDRLAENYGEEQFYDLEREEKYYPFLCHFIMISCILLSAVLFIYLSDKGYFTNSISEETEIGKIMMTCISLGIVNIFAAMKIYSRKNIRCRIKAYDAAQYIQNDDIKQDAPYYETVSRKAENEISDCNEAEYKNETESMAGSFNKTGYRNTEESRQADYNIQEASMIDDNSSKTVVLADYLENIVHNEMPVLIPQREDIYERIYLDVFPFYVGKLAVKNNVAISNPTVSRYHAKIERTDEGFRICDLSSTNGTFINGVRLEMNEKTRIKNSDKIAFADVEYIFSCPSENDVVEYNN